MIAEHFDAVRALIPSKYTVHDTDAGTEPVAPYIVLWGGDFLPFSVDVADSRAEVEGTIGVTCVALMAGAARQLQSTIGALLDGQTVQVPGRRGFELTLEETRPVLVDREVQIPTAGGVGRYPFYGVLIFRVQTTEGSA